jgi:diguanylate cyclase (GGDEF)-like protein/PAS domain S-box-containing protein
MRSSSLPLALILLHLPLLAFSQAIDPPGHPHPLRTVQEFQKLANPEAGKAIPVQLRGVVTYSDPEWGLLFFADPTGSIFIDVRGSKTRYPLGTRAGITGISAPGPVSPIVAQPKVIVLGHGPAPTPERRSLAELNDRVGESQFVITEGVLRSCDTGWDRLCFRIFDGATMAWVVVPEKDSPAAHRLIGSTVKVRGVSGSHTDAANRRQGAQVFVNSLEDIEVQELASTVLLSPGAERPLQTVQEIHNLGNIEAGKSHAVELQGVVTYSDPEWGLLFIRDRTGSIYLNVHGINKAYPPGTNVLVNGVTSAGDVAPDVVRPTIQIIGHGPLPTPEPRSVSELNTGRSDSSWVITEGVLRPCDKTWARICFRIFDGKELAWVIVPHPDNPAAQRLIGATVKVNGVAGSHMDAENKRVGAQVFVNGLEDFKVEDAAMPDSFASTPTPIGNLRNPEADRRFSSQVHVRGTVTWESPRRFFIQDNTGALSIETADAVDVRSGSTVDVVGFPGHGDLSALQLSDSTVRVAAIQSSKSNVAPLDLTAEEVLKRSLNGRRVRLKAHLISQSASATEYLFLLDDGQQRFSAKLLRNNATREVVGLAADSNLELTGVAVIRTATPQWPESLQLLVDSPADMVVLGGNNWLTLKRGLSILGGMAVCILVPLIWVKQLRSIVRKQTTTIRTRLENELQLETKYQRLFERNLAAVFCWRSDGIIFDFNLAFVKMLGFRTREEFVGHSYWDFEVDPFEQEQLRRALQEGAVSNRDTTLRRDNGVSVQLLMNITPVDTPEGTVYETTAIDVTQLRHNQAELQKAKDAAVYESLNDALTGLHNRRFMSDELNTILARAKREKSMIGAIYLDLDGFKAVNDSLGHSIGDSLLVEVANCLRSRVRESDLLARLGGDEFLVLLCGLHAKEEAAKVAADLLETISNPLSVEGHDITIGASIGISIFPDSATGGEELMRQADSAMYAAKREGKNRVMYFTPEIGSLVHERLTLENELRGAIARNEISVHYQPEFEVASLRLVRFEALARWTHPTLGRIPPDKFIPIAEESGLIVALGAYIMQYACAEAVKWQGILPYPVQVAVNVSSIQFHRKGFVEEVGFTLRQTGLKPELLQIEFTESVMLGGALSSAEPMNRLRAMGISLAIDDFGTGYSCLSYLPSLPFDALKIDRAFVKDLGKRPESESMVRTLIMLANNIGMRVIVEGVETQEQLELIRTYGANEVQGYLLGRPTPTPVETFLRPEKQLQCSTT